MKQLLLICAVVALVRSDLSAQNRNTSLHLSGRAVRSSHTAGLSSRRQTKLNTQVINGVLKQNTPTKAGQTQITAIEFRLNMRLPQTVELWNGRRWWGRWLTKDGKIWAWQVRSMREHRAPGLAGWLGRRRAYQKFP